MSNVEFVGCWRALAEAARNDHRHDVRITPDKLLRLVELAEAGMVDGLTPRRSRHAI